MESKFLDRSFADHWCGRESVKTYQGPVRRRGHSRFASARKAHRDARAGTGMSIDHCFRALLPGS
jgi:hypothetical protein